MLFCQRREAQAVKGLREKNTLFAEERRKGRFFPKQPEGLDLDGQAERANFACFFEFLNHQSISFFLKNRSTRRTKRTRDCSESWNRFTVKKKYQNKRKHLNLLTFSKRCRI